MTLGKFQWTGASSYCTRFRNYIGIRKKKKQKNSSKISRWNMAKANRFNWYEFHVHLMGFTYSWKCQNELMYEEILCRIDWLAQFFCDCIFTSEKWRTNDRMEHIDREATMKWAQLHASSCAKYKLTGYITSQLCDFVLKLKIFTLVAIESTYIYDTPYLRNGNKNGWSICIFHSVNFPCTYSYFHALNIHYRIIDMPSYLMIWENCIFLAERFYEYNSDL